MVTITLKKEEPPPPPPPLTTMVHMEMDPQTARVIRFALSRVVGFRSNGSLTPKGHELALETYTALADNALYYDDPAIWRAD